jgi:hypothetical protein
VRIQTIKEMEQQRKDQPEERGKQNKKRPAPAALEKTKQADATPGKDLEEPSHRTEDFDLER